jgi:hypothetical protein
VQAAAPLRLKAVGAGRLGWLIETAIPAALD